MEIKTIIDSLRHCTVSEGDCLACPSYHHDSGCLDRLHAKAVEALEFQQKRIVELETEKLKPLAEFLAPMDKYKGLKRKFLVFKSDTGKRIENCFVLRPDKDPAAVEALRTYARVTDNQELSADICKWVGTGEAADRWIPGKKPPKVWKDENGDAINFLSFIPGTGVDIANWIEPVRCWFCMGVPCKVTYWKPLPEPPKED